MSIHFIPSARPQRKQGSGQFFSITKRDDKTGLWVSEREQKFSRGSHNRGYVKRQLWREEIAQMYKKDKGWREGILEVFTIIHYHPCMTATEIWFPGILEKLKAWRNQRLKKPKFSLSSVCSAMFFLFTCLPCRYCGWHSSLSMELPWGSAEVGLGGAPGLPSTEDVGLAVLTEE